MSSQYDRIGNTNNEQNRRTQLNETTSILTKSDSRTNHFNHGRMNKISDEPILTESMDDLNSSLDRSERLTDASSASFYSRSFQLKRQMWLKNRNLLIIIAIIIIGIIIFITILISEPWKS